MGYPHKPHPRETVLLSRYFGEADARTYKGWVKRGGDAALEQARAMEPVRVTDNVNEAGLRGRGGAGFSTGLKWSFMTKEKKKPHYLCVNADESEPGTFKDREIMRWTPHALLEGTAIAAHAIQAEVAYIYIRGEFTEPLTIMEKALADARSAGVFGDLKIHLHRGAGAYICGEETALMNSIEGKRGNPRIKPPFPAAFGVFGMPTTINNVETLAAVPPILTNGPAWYKKLPLSNPKSTGTKLFSVCGHVQKPGNYELTMGFPLKDLLYELCGGMRPGRTLKACIPGGSSVPILDRAETEACLLDYEGAVERGTMLGSGGVIVFDDSADMVYQIMRLARFYAHESCAQCTQCREGTAWTTKILERILAGQGKTADLDLLLDLPENMTGKTICLPSDSCAPPVCSWAKKFRSQLQDFTFQEGRAGTRYSPDYPKRFNPVEDFGPDVLYVPNRCILCTRCVRFMEDVAQEPVLNVSERGDRAYIGVHPETRLDHPWAGNVVDLCPVGSLLSKDFLHKARAWELDKTASVCTGCSQGCNVTLDTRDDVVVRVRPRPNLEVNRYFMCAHGRMNYRWMNRGDRIEAPLVKRGGELHAN